MDLTAYSIDDTARAPLEQWLLLLEQWNKRIDLTAARTHGELTDLMLADASVLAKRMAVGARVVDVGTGAGAPGLALAIMRPDLKVTLVEPLAKRTSFLRTVLGTIGRPDVVILRERGEAVASHSPNAFDVALSRATLPPTEWVPLALRLASATLVLVARDAPPTIEGARIDEDISYVWPATSAQRRATRYVTTA